MASVNSPSHALSGERTPSGMLIPQWVIEQSPICLAALRIICEFEEGPGGGVATRAYLCPSGKWTLGLGETAGIRQGMTCTVDEAWKMLLRDLTARTDRVKALIKVQVNDNELGALVSLVYNIGTTAFAQSTLLKVLNKGDRIAAAAQFLRWNKGTVNGKLVELPGLKRRRAAEQVVWLTPEEGAWTAPQPQAVEGDKPLLSSSPTMQGAAALTTIGALGGLKDTVQPAGDFLRWARDLLGDLLPIPAHWIGPGLLIAIGVLLMWRRYQQRQKGLA